MVWNFVNHHVKNVAVIDLKKLRRLLRRNDHFMSFTFTGLSGSTVRNRLTVLFYPMFLRKVVSSLWGVGIVPQFQVKEEVLGE